jgi:hypothetical protein
MRMAFGIIFLGGLLVVGCAGRKAATPAFAPTAQTGRVATNPAPPVAPTNSLAGRVVLVNTVGRFVVLNFPLGQMAAVDQRLALYRRGLKVGDVKVTGPQREDNIVADLTAGDAQVGDEARPE